MKIINTILLEDGNSNIDFLLDELIRIKYNGLYRIKIEEKNGNITICGY